jgi:hypothetical protein
MSLRGPGTSAGAYAATRPFKGVQQPGQGDVRREVQRSADVIGFAVEPSELALEILQVVPHDLFRAVRMRGGEHGMPVPGDGSQLSVQEF